MHGEQTRRAMAAQPEWLAQVPTDKRFPDGVRLLFTGCGTSFHAAQTGGFAVQALEAVLRPPVADIMVCVSHEGATELTMEAERALVSRATAYRYFSSVEALISETAADRGMKPLFGLEQPSPQSALDVKVLPCQRHAQPKAAWPEG